MSGQGSIRRLREFDVRPNRELGQNFLIDDNVLRLVAEAAELSASDVVLEVGGGLGVLSEHLAPRVRHLHVVEVDRALEPPLRDAVGPFDNVDLHFADAVTLDLAALRPRATQGRREPPVRSRGHCRPQVDRGAAGGASSWIAMVQLEVGRRLAADARLEDLRRDQRSRAALVRREGAAEDLAPRSSIRCRRSSPRLCA